MEVKMTPEQRALVSNAVASGRLQRPEDAVQQALLLWEERDRRHADILVSVDLAEASVARGEGHAITENSVYELAKEVSRRGRARLAAEQHQTR